MTDRLRGIIPPLVTPLRGRDELDVAGLERLVEHVLDGGVHGLFLLGTTGEGPGLSHRLRRDLVARACRQVGKRVPVLVGITDSSTTEAVELAHAAAEAGAEALVMAPPYYYPTAAPELLDHIVRLAPELPLPLFLYNMPVHTKTVLEPGTVERAMDVPNIVGIKDSSGSMTYYHQLLRLRGRRPEWSVLMGPEELLAESVLLGGDGGVCGGANLWPRLYVDLYEAARRGDLEAARSLHARVIGISSTLYRVGSYGSGYLKGLKAALRELGLCDDFMAEPFSRFSDEERGAVRRALEETGVPRPLPR